MLINSLCIELHIAAQAFDWALPAVAARARAAAAAAEAKAFSAANAAERAYWEVSFSAKVKTLPNKQTNKVFFLCVY